MRDVVLDVEEIGVPVGLEVVVVAVAVFVDFIFVAVDEIGGGMGGDFEGDASEGVGADFVVVVEEGEKFAVSEGEGGIGRRGDVAVGLAQDDFDAGVFFLIRFENFADVRFFRSVVGDAKFPVFVELAADGFDGADEPFLRRVVGRHQHRDERLFRECGDFRADLVGDLGGEAVVGGGPGGVGIGRRRCVVGGTLDLAREERGPRAGLILGFEDERADAAFGDFDF